MCCAMISARDAAMGDHEYARVGLSAVQGLDVKHLLVSMPNFCGLLKSLDTRLLYAHVARECTPSGFKSIGCEPLQEKT
jgi:hypothetical protein